jgi:hypothetical protein
MRRFWLTVAAVVLLAPVARPIRARGQNVSAPLPVNGIPLPAIVQKASNSSSGSVASLARAFPSSNVAGNSIVVVCGVGNGTAPTISDTPANAYKQAAQVANGTAFNVAIFVATNIAAGANTVTVNNGGTAASIAMEIYEVSGLITTSTTAALDSTSTNTSAAATTSPAVTAAPLLPNELSFVAFGLGTAAQTITVAAPYANDSGQLNPATPAGLFSFVSGSFLSSTMAGASPSATVGTGEPWGVAVAAFKTASLPIEGAVQGNVASGTADAGNPVEEGGQARTSLITAVLNGQRVLAMYDKFGRRVVLPVTIRDLVSSGSVTVTTTTETTLLAAGGSGVFLDLAALSCTNTSATLTRVDIRDATGGTVRISMALAASGGGFVLPLQGVPWPQTTANNNWTMQLSTAVTDVRCNIEAVKNQ